MSGSVAHRLSGFEERNEIVPSRTFLFASDSGFILVCRHTDSAAWAGQVGADV